MTNIWVWKTVNNNIDEKIIFFAQIVSSLWLHVQHRYALIISLQQISLTHKHCRLSEVVGSVLLGSRLQTCLYLQLATSVISVVNRSTASLDFGNWWTEKNFIIREVTLNTSKNNVEPLLWYLLRTFQQPKSKTGDNLQQWTQCVPHLLQEHEELSTMQRSLS